MKLLSVLLLVSCFSTVTVFAQAGHHYPNYHNRSPHHGPYHIPGHRPHVPYPQPVDPFVNLEQASLILHRVAFDFENALDKRFHHTPLNSAADDFSDKTGDLLDEIEDRDYKDLLEEFTRLQFHYQKLQKIYAVSHFANRDYYIAQIWSSLYSANARVQQSVIELTTNMLNPHRRFYRHYNSYPTTPNRPHHPFNPQPHFR